MKYFAVFDIGGSAIKYALMSGAGEFVKNGSVKTPSDGFDTFVNVIQEVVENFQETHTLTGIAMSMPGAVEVKSGYIGGSSAVPYIHGPNIKQVIGERTNLPVQLENDANCAALAEGWIGAAKDVNDYVAIVIGTGVGGAIVLDKKIRHGKNLHAGEFGYMIMDGYLEKPLGNSWSSLASTAGFVRQVANRKGIDQNTLDGKKVFEMADQGDEEVRKEIEIFIKRLAVGIFNLQYCLDPEKILIGGAISNREGLIEQINEQLSKMKDNVSLLEVSVERCKFGNDSNLIGALYHFLQQEEAIAVP